MEAWMMEQLQVKCEFPVFYWKYRFLKNFEPLPEKTEQDSNVMPHPQEQTDPSVKIPSTVQKMTVKSPLCTHPQEGDPYRVFDDTVISCLALC